MIELFPKLSGWESYKKIILVATEFVSKFVQQRLENKTTENDNEEPNDFADVFMKEIVKTVDPDSSFFGKRGGK